MQICESGGVCRWPALNAVRTSFVIAALIFGESVSFFPTSLHWYRWVFPNRITIENECFLIFGARCDFSRRRSRVRRVCHVCPFSEGALGRTAFYFARPATLVARTHTPNFFFLPKRTGRVPTEAR